MTDVPHGAEWWRANDGKWYPPELRAERRPPAATLGAPPISPAARARQAMAADDAPAAAEAPTLGSTGASARKMAEAAEEIAAAVDDAAVLLELRGSALTSDIDRIGDRMEISARGVVQRGRGNKERGAFAMSEIAAVEAEKTHKGYWLRVVAMDGRELLQQGLEAGPAEEARDLVRAHAPAAAQAAEDAAARAAAEAAAEAAAAEKAATEKAAAEAAAAEKASTEKAAAAEKPAAEEAGGAPTLDVPDQIRKLAELHELGILTDEEFQSKKQQLLDRM